MAKPLSQDALDTIFLHARSYNGWQDRPVSDALLQQLYDLMKFGPTSANCSPARFIFVKTQGAKERLKPHLIPSNVDKVMAAPVTAIIGMHQQYYDRIPELFPHNPSAREWFSSGGPATQDTMFRNASLQGAYLMIAARALGLDCGPMSGFDNDGVDKAFFADGDIQSNFLCCLGYGDPASIFDRSPRLPFDDACQLL